MCNRWLQMMQIKSVFRYIHGKHCELKAAILFQELRDRKINAIAKFFRKAMRRRTPRFYINYHKKMFEEELSEDAMCREIRCHNYQRCIITFIATAQNVDNRAEEKINKFCDKMSTIY